MEIRMNEPRLNAGENNARTLTVFVDEAYRDYEIRLALLTPAGRRCLTPELTLEEGAAVGLVRIGIVILVIATGEDASCEFLIGHISQISEVVSQELLYRHSCYDIPAAALVT